MSQPTASDVHVNVPLTNLSVAYIQDQKNFIASQVFPLVGSDKQSNKYFTYPKGHWFRNEAQERAPGTESAGGGHSVTTADFSTKVVAYHRNIPDQVRGNADAALSLDRDATNFVTQKALIKRDVDWANAYFTTSVWSADIGVGSGVTTAWDGSGSTPIKDIRKQIYAGIAEKTGILPNTLVLGAKVWQVLQDHSDFLDRIQFGQPGGPSIVSPALLAQVLELDRVIIARSVQNTANEGATDAFSFIHGKHALLCYSNPSPSLLAPSAGYTFAWTGQYGSGQDGQRISTFRMEHLKSERVEIELSYSFAVVSQDLGVFFNSMVS